MLNPLCFLRAQYLFEKFISNGYVPRNDALSHLFDNPKDFEEYFARLSPLSFVESKILRYIRKEDHDHFWMFVYTGKSDCFRICEHYKNIPLIFLNQKSKKIRVDVFLTGLFMVRKI